MHTSSQHGGRFKTFITTQNYILDSRLENVLQGKMSNSKALLEHQDYFKVFAFSWFFSKKIVLCEISPIYYFCGFFGFTVFRKKPKSFFFRRKSWKKSTEEKVRPRMNNGEEKKVGWNPSEGQDGHSSSSLRNNRAETSSGKKPGQLCSKLADISSEEISS